MSVVMVSKKIPKDVDILHTLDDGKDRVTRVIDDIYERKPQLNRYDVKISDIYKVCIARKIINPKANKKIVFATIRDILLDNTDKKNGRYYHILGYNYKIAGEITHCATYYRLAIRAGNIGAIGSMAILYFFKNGKKDSVKLAIAYQYVTCKINTVPEDIFDTYVCRLYYAFKYLFMAIEHKHPPSMYNIATLFLNCGDYLLAEKYLLMAHENGIDFALDSLQIVYKRHLKFFLPFLVKKISAYNKLHTDNVQAVL